MIVSLFFQKTIKSFELGKETCVRKIAVKDADGIVFVERNDDLVIGFLDCFEVLGRDKPSDTDQGKVFLSTHELILKQRNDSFKRIVDSNSAAIKDLIGPDYRGFV